MTLMSKNDYFDERNIKNNEKLQQILSELPYFCTEFFIGIEQNTSPLTRLNYALDLRVFFEFLIEKIPIFFGNTIENLDFDDLEKVSVTHLEIYLSYLSYYKRGQKTFRNGEKAKARKISSVRAMFKYFYNKDKLSQNVSSKILLPKIHDKEIIRLDSSEVSEMLDTVENADLNSERQCTYNLNNTRERDLAILALMLGTGIRVSECVGINIGDIDFEQNAFLVTRKGGNQTRLYFPDEVASILFDYAKWREKRLETAKITNEDAFFISIQNRRITVRGVEYLVKKYSKIVSPLKKISPHKLRSTFGTELYQETKDIYVVAEVLGHKDINTTKKHYAAISEDIKKAASMKVKLKKDDDDGAED